jgi:ATP-binding protein involved in chromosome partitioning
MVIRKDEVWQALKNVQFPGFDRSVIGAVQEVAVDEEGAVTISLAIAHLGSRPQQTVLDAVQQAVKQLPQAGPVYVQIVQRAMPGQGQSEPSPRGELPTIIAVGSGKGGVGKSTVAVNLAVSLAHAGLRVALMDADIYGPNIPRMLGVDELLPGQKGKITPAERYGVKIVSVGLIVETNQAVVWRGPMTDKLLRQFLFSVDWGDTGVIVVDLPPGTGDIVLSLAKHAQPSGAIVVVTPQDVALDDARKALTMFKRLDIPVLGLVENMSYFECGECGTRHHLFGEGGGARLAREAGISLLGEVPLEPVVREGGDHGHPVVLDDTSSAGAALHTIAARVHELLPQGGR